MESKDNNCSDLPQTNNDNGSQPSPLLTPEKVIEIQLYSMKHNDEPTPDSGIGITFIFASPANKLNTGPLSRFISMVKNPHYSVLLNHKSSKFIPLRADGSVWQISIVDKDGNNSTFVWQLSKQTQGPFKDCWMLIPFLELNELY